MARIHLIEGPVGAGKSTFAISLSNSHSGLHLDLDNWMANLFRQDRPSSGNIEWYLERKDRCIEQIWKLSCGLIEIGTDVILELGLIQESSRRYIYDRVDGANYDLTIYVLEASRSIRRERVRLRNILKGETFSMEVPDQFFELSSNMWEPLSDNECTDRDVRFIFTETEELHLT